MNSKSVIMLCYSYEKPVSVEQLSTQQREKNYEKTWI